ncbi:MAG: type VI secretion system baseplate subunit TssE [Pseudomonadota bacterium]
MRSKGEAEVAQPAADAVQPSLWDRLVDDLPAINAEVDELERLIADRLDDETVEKHLEAARDGRVLEGELDEEIRRPLAHLAHLNARKRVLGQRGVVVSPDVLREAVRRDMEALFNTVRYDTPYLLTEREHLEASGNAAPLDDYPHVQASTVNYGVPSLAGRTSRDFDRDVLAADLRETIIRFEPRLDPASVNVVVRIGDKKELAGLRIEISGNLILTPVPERLVLTTLLDLDTGRARTRAG